jgi:alkylated DNA repair protein alkB family protein 1
MRRAKLLAAHKQAAQPDNVTPLRAAEKKYQSRVPPPDYSDVLEAKCMQGEDVSVSCLVDGQELFMDRIKVVKLDNHPGVFLLPGALTANGQRLLVQRLLTDTAKAPNACNLDTHYVIPECGLWACFQEALKGQDVLIPAKHEVEAVDDVAEGKPPNGRRLIDDERNLDMSDKKPAPPSNTVKSEMASKLMRKLRWTNLGLLYHWTSKSYQLSERVPVPQDWADLSCAVLSALDINGFRPESGIVNYYQLKSTLMAHVDQSEVAQQPLVSVSLGHSAIFLLGGETRDIAPTALYLHSGDVLIMSGQSRKAFHGIPRILEKTLPDHFQGFGPYTDYLSTTRINVNIRQVF